MSGIAGVYSASTDTDYPRLTANAMTRRLARVGTEQSAIWIDVWQGVALGHRHPIAADPTMSDAQPKSSQSGRFVITYDGEIYNADELRTELAAGPEAASCDSGLLLACVDQWGLEQTLKRVNGVFSLALWDRWRGLLSLATDRLGQKPLYYACLGADVIFASESRALSAHDEFDGAVDEIALGQYLQKGFISAPRTIYRRVSKLEPGSFVLCRRGALPHAQRYWAPPVAGTANALALSQHDAVDTLDRLLVDAVRLRLGGNAPVGVLFSGGIHSTAVLARARNATDGAMTAFTIRFEEAAHSGAAHARAITDYLECASVEIAVSSRDALAMIPELAANCDEPFGDASGITGRLMAGAARRHVAAALCGSGGDELFSTLSPRVNNSLSTDVLVKDDRVTMTVGLDARFPMLDHRLMEWAAALPESIRMHGGVGSWPLKQLVSREVPHHLLHQPTERFELPIAAWLRAPLREWAETLLSQANLRNHPYLDALELRRQWSEHVADRRDWRHTLWRPLMFLAWEQHVRETRHRSSATGNGLATAANG